MNILIPYLGHFFIVPSNTKILTILLKFTINYFETILQISLNCFNSKIMYL
jgi:hypothetical protein